MQHGDISGEPPKRLWAVYEGLVGILRTDLPPAPRKGLLRRRTASREPSPADYTVNAKAASAIYRTMVYDLWHIELVTFLGDAFAYELAEYLPTQMVYAAVLSRTPQGVARELARRPDVHRVYFPDRAHLLTFGSRGLHLPPERADQIGRL